MRVNRNISSKSQPERTLEYYERNAQEYFNATCDADLTTIYDRFTRSLTKGGHILDAGSGSGRDTLAFLRRGYSVSAFDSSPALCKLSTQLTGVRTRVLRFQEFTDKEKYDGIWACASLLHLPTTELSDVIARFIRSLKCGAVLYMSFKHGAGERVSGDGRFFTDMTEDHLEGLLQKFPGLKLKEVWKTDGEGQFLGRGEWLNALVSKERSR